MQTNDSELRKQLLALLKGGNAHTTLDKAVSNFPPAFYNSKFSSIPYSAWQLLEHIRLAQWDILEFIRNPEHKSPKWPEGYWPPPDDEANPEKWDSAIQSLKKDLEGFESIVSDPETDFFAPLAHAKGYNIFREILLVADHNAYHLGQFLVLKRLLKI